MSSCVDTWVNCKSTPKIWQKFYRFLLLPRIKILITKDTKVMEGWRRCCHRVSASSECQSIKKCFELILGVMLIEQRDLPNRFLTEMRKRRTNSILYWIAFFIIVNENGEVGLPHDILSKTEIESNVRTMVSIGTRYPNNVKCCIYLHRNIRNI